MKIAVIGSRSLCITDLAPYLAEVCEIISGGAAGIDACTAEYAKKHQLPLMVFSPEYPRYGRTAPIIRNKKIVDYADRILAFWDGKSKGTLSVIQYAQKTNKSCKVILLP